MGLFRRQIIMRGGIDRSVTLAHTAPVELYSNSFSHCSRKVRLVLAELGISYRHHAIDLIETGRYQTQSPEYLQVNPSGLVPTLVHEGRPVFESDDILAYAQTIAGDDAPRLVPVDPALADQMNHWLDFCAIVSADIFGNMQTRAGACIPGLTMPIFMASVQYVPLSQVLKGFLVHFTVKSPALFTAFKLFGIRNLFRLKPLKTLVHNSRDCMQIHLQTLNNSLEAHGQPWILGETYSLADITIGCLMLRLEETGWLNWFSRQRDLTLLLAYYQRMKERPAWSEAITDQGHPIISMASNDLAKLQKDLSLAEIVYGPTGG